MHLTALRAALMKASLRPWGVFPDFVPGRATESVIIIGPDEEEPRVAMAIERQTDAHLIVTAVNALDVLVAVAEAAQEFYADTQLLGEFWHNNRAARKLAASLRTLEAK